MSNLDEVVERAAVDAAECALSYLPRAFQETVVEAMDCARWAYYVTRVAELEKQRAALREEEKRLVENQRQLAEECDRLRGVSRNNNRVVIGLLRQILIKGGRVAAGFEDEISAVILQLEGDDYPGLRLKTLLDGIERRKRDLSLAPDSQCPCPQQPQRPAVSSDDDDDDDDNDYDVGNDYDDDNVDDGDDDDGTTTTWQNTGMSIFENKMGESAFSPSSGARTPSSSSENFEHISADVGLH